MKFVAKILNISEIFSTNRIYLQKMLYICIKIETKILIYQKQFTLLIIKRKAL